VNRLANSVICFVAALVGIGLVMIYSVTAGRFGEHPEQSLGMVNKHLVCIGLGVAAFLAAMNVDYHVLRRSWKWLFGITVVLLVGVLFFGVWRNGARRWFSIYGAFSFQPSEMAKIIVPLFVAFFVSSRPREELRTFRRGFLLSVGAVCIVAGLILAEPDFGTAALVGAIGLITLLVYGLNLGHTAIMLVPGAAGMAGIALCVPYMRDRVMMWIDPWRDAEGSGYQIIQSLISIGSGGLLGKGLGWSQQKLLFLPEAHTDFIFPIIGEEFGLWGTVLVLLLFAGLLFTGVRITRAAPDLFGSALAFGITLMITVQAAFNIAVTTKALPTKGISLPFISFGGSSMFFTLAAVGILVNVARQAVLAAEERRAEPSALKPVWSGPRQEAAG
jgi:cell division protein FtsW